QSIEAIRVTSNKNFDVVLKVGSILSGTVRDSAARTISDAELMVFGIEPHVLRVTQKLDANGAFSLTLAPGKYYLALKHSEQEAGKGKPKNTPFLCPFFQVIELDKDFKHDISLPPLISFKGKVTNHDGHPMAAVRVIITGTEKPENVFAKEIAMTVSTLTMKDGSFECLLQKGTYNVRLSPPDDSHLAEKTVAAIFVDQDRKRNYSLEPGYILSGKVLHKGTAVPNATVNVIGVSLDSATHSNEDGEYLFSLPGGTYEVVVAAQPDSLGSVSTMELAPSKSSLILDHDTELDINMEEGVLVTGTVLDPTTQARPGVQLSLFATSNGEFDAQCAKRRPLWLGITGDDGGYEFRLQPDKYWLVLNNQASTGHLIDVSGSQLTNDLTIDDVCLVCFEVVSENDEPIPNCQVSFEAYELKNDKPRILDIEEVAMPSYTSDDGRCTLTLPQGVYSFDFHPPEASAHSSRLIRQLSVGADMTRRVRLLGKEEPARSK
ncbi:MAG: hypothetical protein K2X81_23800, partial [Candidatus Obscuribacterales bacterium]|nr:hypothetical protein [Candidatus Obscuribacterales bacterium]